MSKISNANRSLCQSLFILIVVLTTALQLNAYAGAASQSGNPLTEAVRLELENILKESSAPGGVVAFVLPGGARYIIAAGLADKESGRKMHPQSRMLSASIGKSFVGATALALAQSGELDLDTPINTWLGNRPWFDRLPNRESITLRHLLHHQSGLVDHVYLPEFAQAIQSGSLDKGQYIHPEQLIEFALDKEPLFPSGDGFKYTDTGYLLAGLAIEAATGKTYYGELRRQLLDPLDLTLTSPSDHKNLPGLEPGYLPAENPYGLPPKTLDNKGYMIMHPGSEWTGGGLISNAGDLAHFARELYSGRALIGDYLDELLEPKPRQADKPLPAYGLGQGIRETPYGIGYGHTGWIPGYTSVMAYWPDYDVSLAAQFNMIPGGGPAPVALTMERLPSLIIETLKQKKPIK